MTRKELKLQERLLIGLKATPVVPKKVETRDIAKEVELAAVKKELKKERQARKEQETKCHELETKCLELEMELFDSVTAITKKI